MQRLIKSFFVALAFMAGLLAVSVVLVALIHYGGMMGYLVVIFLFFWWATWMFWERD